MNKQKNDNHNYETSLDALWDYISLLPKATVKLSNISMPAEKIGVVQTLLESTGWTHWLKIPYIIYAESTE